MNTSSKVCRNDTKCEFCAHDHFFDEYKAIDDHKKCVNCDEKHSTWSFQCDVKTQEKKKLNDIWNSKSIMHTKTSRVVDDLITNHRSIVDKAHFMSSLETSQLQTNNATQQSTQYEFILMSLNLNEFINRFSTLSIIIDKRNHSQDSIDVSSTIFRRLFSVVQVNNSQSSVNALTILRYKFKSSSRIKKSLKKSSQTSYQSNLITQNIQEAIKWWHNSLY